MNSPLTTATVVLRPRELTRLYKSQPVRLAHDWQAEIRGEVFDGHTPSYGAFQWCLNHVYWNGGAYEFSPQHRLDAEWPRLVAAAINHASKVKNPSAELVAFVQMLEEEISG